jgi:RHS repeat-associated protein
VQWPLVDHLGTVRDLVENDGALGEHYEYDSFGKIVSGDTSVIRYLYTSREHDPDTGLQYNRARWYDAAVGRWISQDPIGFEAGDANLTRFVGNRVVDSADPSGLKKPGDPWDPADPFDPWDPEDPFGFMKAAQQNKGYQQYYGNFNPNDPAGVYRAFEEAKRMRERMIAEYRPEPILTWPWGSSHTRPLTPGEKDLLEVALAGHLDTEGLVVGIGGLFTQNYEENAKTPYLTPWFPLHSYYDDFSLAPLHAQGDFVHEMTHVLQTQQGNDNVEDWKWLVIFYAGEYDASYKIDPDRYGEPLWTFNMEQQAHIIENNHKGVYGKYAKELQEKVKQTIGDFQTQRPSK